ncbi:phage portal protein [Secundilactobacillus similis]|uniref:phage portal protein n=1 Tax=Secundilactobacillus similis TaxID=414682 RepID=UPI0006D1BEAA|nr:phage portal protein [Secundilactobacillus similis]
MDIFRPKNTQDFIISGVPLDEHNVSNNGDTSLGDNITLTDDDVFLYRSGANLLDNLEDVRSIVSYHENYIAEKYKMKRDYYKGRHHAIIQRPPKPHNKPDYRLLINLPKKLVSTFNGYFSGDPVSIKYHSDSDASNDKMNDEIQSWLNDNDYGDTFSEWAKQADIYGRSYLYVYQIDGDLRIAVCSPRDTIMIYDDSIQHRPVAAIRYSTNSNKQYDTLITPKADYLISNDNANSEMKVTNVDPNNPDNVVKEDIHDFESLPVIELAEDDERIGIFDDVISLIDAVDLIQSAKVNDVSSFADQYLVVKGQKLTEEQVTNIQDKRFINLYRETKTSFNNTDSNMLDPDAFFLTPDPSDETQENALNRLIDMVYQVSQVVNLNDSNFGVSAQSISGVALLQRYQPMQAKARTKAKKMDKGLRQLFSIMFAYKNLSGNVSDLTFDHKQSIPHNVSEEADIVGKLNGQVSDPTKLSYLSGIDDPDKEIERLHEQQKQDQQATANIVKNYLSDQKKGGVVDDDNGQATTGKNTATNQSGRPNGQAD